MIKIDNEIIIFDKFPDGTPLIKLYDKSHGVIEWKYDSMEELFNLECIVDKLKQDGVKDMVLFMPYVPNARQDRIVNNEDVFTLKTFCNIINKMNFKNIYIHDVHSSVASALLNNCIVKTNLDLVHETIGTIHTTFNKRIDCIFYPDYGAYSKYTKTIKTKLSLAYGIKERDWATGEIKGLTISGDVKDKTILIVDDISSYGGTFFYSAKALLEQGAKEVYLCVTHCENTVMKGKLLATSFIKHIYTTDSILRQNHEKITILKGE